MALKKFRDIENLVDDFKDRYEALMQEMTGKQVDGLEAITKYWASESTPKNEVFCVINPSRIRTRVDDFSTILREIKRQLGK